MLFSPKAFKYRQYMWYIAFSMASRAFHRVISSPLPLLISGKAVPFGFQRMTWSSPWAMGMLGEEDRPLKLQILVRLSGWETHVPSSGHRAQHTGTLASEAAFSVLTFILMLIGFGEIKCKFVSKWISLGWGWERRVQEGVLLGAFALKLKHLCSNS